MKTCIIQSDKTKKDIVEHNKLFCNLFYHDKTHADKYRKIELDINEKIKLCNDIDSVNILCVTEGSWLIKTQRISYDFKNEPIPMIVENKQVKYPFVDDKDLPKLYLDKQYGKFAVEIEKRIFDNIGRPFENYYAAVAYTLGEKNLKKGQEKISMLLNHNKCYAEGWCLLGDILTMLTSFTDAKKAYEKAINNGKERNIFDPDPVWLSRYDDYPTKKIDEINKLLNSTQFGSRQVF
jgi:hypothetical protein